MSFLGRVGLITRHLLSVLLHKLLVGLSPLLYRASKRNSDWLRESDLVQVLVGVRLHHAFVLLHLLPLLVELSRVVRRRDAKLGEVASRLLRALMRMSVLNAQSQNGSIGVLRLEDGLDLAFKTEVVVLAQVDLFDLEFDRLFDDGLQVLDHFLVALAPTLDLLINVAVHNLEDLFLLVDLGAHGRSNQVRKGLTG